MAAASLVQPSFYAMDRSQQSTSQHQAASSQSRPRASPPQLPIKDDRSWDEILSSRIPSQYDDDNSRPLWQQWIEAVQAAVDDDVSVYANARAGPSTPPSSSSRLPRLSYPPSRPHAPSEDELASNRALAKAAFSSPKRKSKSSPVPVAPLDNPQAPFPPSQPTSPPLPPPPSRPSDSALAVLVPLLVLLSTLLLLLLLFLIMLIIVRRRARIALHSGDGPLDIGREEELEGAGGLEGVEERWLESQDDATRRGYARAKDWLLSHPPGSVASEITISQFLSIQEKGVSAWSFEPDYDQPNPSCFVEARTEITFVADGDGMAASEGGGCAVQSNLPLPKINDVYYWEAKMFSKPASTNIALGLATKPYPSFRMPGWSKHSVGFFSQDGFKCHNYPFAAQSYGPAYVQGDVIGVGYRPRTGTVFFTRNGKKLDDAFVGLQRYNVFPTIGADGPAEVHVNLGQAGFVFIEANVKKWGLAPMVGTLAPPPAYGQERGSILIEAAGPSSGDRARGRSTPPPPPLTPLGEQPPQRGRNEINPASHQAAVLAAQRAQHREEEDGGRAYVAPDLRERSASATSTASTCYNPPTPGNLDISLHALRGSANSSSPSSPPSSRGSTVRSTARQQHQHARGNSTGSYFPDTTAPPQRAISSSPPPYSVSVGETASGSRRQHLAPPVSSSSSTASSTSSSSPTHPSARRSSGRTHRAARDAFAAALEGAAPSSDDAAAAGGGGIEYEQRAGGATSGSGADGPGAGWGAGAAAAAAVATATGWGRGAAQWLSGSGSASGSSQRDGEAAV